jgi:hypothetical protein
MRAAKAEVIAQCKPTYYTTHKKKQWQVRYKMCMKGVIHCLMSMKK